MLPSRASTQTWMFLTFALFVGTAVVGVGLYVGGVLRVQIQEARQQALVEQAVRIALLVEQAETPTDKREAARAFSRLTTLDLAVAAQDSLLWSASNAHLLDDGRLQRPDELEPVPQGRVHLAPAPSGSDVIVTLFRPDSGLLLRVVQPEPILFQLVREMQWTLLLGMVMALLLALVGSWIAAHKVTQPLQTITSSALNVGEGELDESIQVETRAAEIQDLAKSLDRASNSFREKIDELERLTRLQSEFIGNVSHEVRNPIFAISGYLEALGSPSLADAQRRRYADKALMNLQRLNNLFNDLIEIARLEYREDLIKPAVFDIQDLVDEVAEMLRPKATDKDLTLVVDNPRFMVEADRNRIRQVLVNLIDNAIAYTDSGSVRCRVRRRLDKIRIEVVDTGKGIAEEHLDRIFERFYRVDPDRSRKSGGTGLGLSIVKQIIQAHGEQMHVESTLGRGTRFWFELPYAGKPVEVGAAE
jgi:signal transduction histidine kinase